MLLLLAAHQLKELSTTFNLRNNPPIDLATPHTSFPSVAFYYYWSKMQSSRGRYSSPPNIAVEGGDFRDTVNERLTTGALFCV